MSSTYLDTGAWPTGVIARYLTVGGGFVDIVVDAPPAEPDATATCSGCQEEEKISGFAWPPREDRRGYVEGRARAWSQDHAERCRAMPHPQATSEETTR
ncbi:hypothetical protein ACQEU3_46590 [Spirillospora sp. CA-253888]